MTMNEIAMDSLEVDSKGAFKYESHSTVWKLYSANHTLASIQRAIENSERIVGVDESLVSEGWKGIPAKSLQTMDEYLRSAWRKLALDELPTRPSSSASDDSTPPSTPTEGRSPVMRATRTMTDKPLFNPFPDEEDYVEFMLKTASTMVIGAFDPFEDEPHVEDIVAPLTPIEGGEEAIFHLPSAFNTDTETEAPDANIPVALMDSENQPCMESFSNFGDLDRLGCRIPQVELDHRKRKNHRKRKQLQRPPVVTCLANTPEEPIKSPSRYPQYMPSTDSSDILSSPKTGQIKRHLDEQRHLLRLLLDD